MFYTCLIQVNYAVFKAVVNSFLVKYWTKFINKYSKSIHSFSQNQITSLVHFASLVASLTLSSKWVLYKRLNYIKDNKMSVMYKTYNFQKN